MPWHMRKVKGGYRVIGGGGKVRAKHTTKAKANRQMNLLRAVKHGWRPSK